MFKLIKLKFITLDNVITLLSEKGIKMEKNIGSRI